MISFVPEKLSNLIGTGNGPTPIDTRVHMDVAADPRLIPGVT
jgi:hypothetical protein